MRTDLDVSVDRRTRSYDDFVSDLSRIADQYVMTTPEVLPNDNSRVDNGERPDDGASPDPARTDIR
jgi:hypothetical protein